MSVNCRRDFRLPPNMCVTCRRGHVSDFPASALEKILYNTKIPPATRNGPKLFILYNSISGMIGEAYAIAGGESIS
jgi:hypothetical protein